jgi:hypothetical protein
MDPPVLRVQFPDQIGTDKAGCAANKCRQAHYLPSLLYNTPLAWTV